MKNDIGDYFQQATKYIRGKLPRGRSGGEFLSLPDKSYPDCPSFSLPPPQKQNGPGLWETILQRRSIRHFTPQPISLAQLSQLLWATQGITHSRHGFSFRAAPSAGALYPVETYLVINRVASLEAGIYYYQVGFHQLKQLKKGDFGLQMAAAALDQEMAATAAVVFCWTGVFARSTRKYGQRAYRYIYLDAGHIAQNLALAAVGLGLGSCQVAALYDEEVNQLLGVDGQRESILYLSVVGHPYS